MRGICLRIKGILKKLTTHWLIWILVSRALSSVFLVATCPAAFVVEICSCEEVFCPYSWLPLELRGILLTSSVSLQLLLVTSEWVSSLNQFTWVSPRFRMVTSSCYDHSMAVGSVSLPWGTRWLGSEISEPLSAWPHCPATFALMPGKEQPGRQPPNRRKETEMPPLFSYTLCLEEAWREKKRPISLSSSPFLLPTIPLTRKWWVLLLVPWCLHLLLQQSDSCYR